MSGIYYRDWLITPSFIGWSAISPNYEASYEGAEDGWVDNGERVLANSIVEIQSEIDAWIEENSK